ncbi:uncharacterized protein DSM5745_03009 [Aspergillus mulundensis]|uniref:Trafficking protein particle complex subunit 12 n=1 Tax=Aspergillus mulundensis TaxID=1810919 RepID=A0A3D8SJ63_9EURO|nr:Uncharacterized protein DSM5745_03009 [Aspergillus mulundensis]RDW86367.1 Uncharacterized protein DSM5745_03009 [Aspergillus mulundensis]
MDGHKHGRNVSRSSRPRSSTKGPLDQPDDPLKVESLSKIPTPLHQNAADYGIYTGESFSSLDPLAPELPPELEKDLSFLLRYDNYHSLSQVDIPHALRSDFISPKSDESLASSLVTLERLLAEGHFLLAAYLSGTILTSPLISPTDTKLIFALFYTRLACLELSGNTNIAAQESKALEDLSSTFYYVEPELEAADAPDHESSSSQHIAPWPLRVLAIRLQSIGFGDPRRGIGGLYEIGLEARREIMRPDIDPAEREIWKQRLSDLGVRTVNALVEMGDFNAAKRSLESLRITESANDAIKLRAVLLLLAIGDVDAARQLCAGLADTEDAIFKPLFSMAEGRYDDAVIEWRDILGNKSRETDEAVVSQNLAVCLLYTGRLSEARGVLESLVQEQHSFSSLVFNLATVYELCSDKAVQLKHTLVENIAKQPVTGHTNLDRLNADFKL